MEFDDILHKATDISKIIRVLGENLEVGSNKLDIFSKFNLLQVRDVFQTGRGNFIVPKGASGEYWISISILMDVFGWHHSLAGNKTAFVMSNYRYEGKKRSENNCLIQAYGGWAQCGA